MGWVDWSGAEGSDLDPDLGKCRALPLSHAALRISATEDGLVSGFRGDRNSDATVEQETHLQHP